MPLINRLSNDYDPTGGVAQGIGSIAAAIRQGPVIAARGRLYGAQTDRQTAMAQEALARAGLLNSQTGQKNDQTQGALEIAEALKQPGAISQDSLGNVVIAAPAFQSVMSSLSKTGSGANDTALGLKNLLSAQNAPNEAQLGRQNKLDVAKVKPVILKPGESAFSQGGPPAQDDGESPSDVDNPQSSSPLAAQLIASLPPAPAKDLPGYTTTTIRDERNPAYSTTDNTNVPPVIKMTNVTTRASSRAPVAAPAAGTPLTPDLATKYLQMNGGDKNKARAAAKADGYTF